MSNTATKRVSTGEARKQLADKKAAAPTYKGPRGNQEQDPHAVEYERRKLETLFA